MQVRRLLILLYYFLFWIVYFELARVCFLLFNTNEFNDATFVQIMATFFHGFKLDLSAVSYVTVASIPLFIICAFFRSYRVLKISLNIFTGIFIAIFSFIIVGDAEVYKYWAFRIDDTPLEYLKTPGAVAASVSTLRIILLATVYLFFAGGTFLLYYFWVARSIKNTKSEGFYSLFYLLIAGFLIIPIRGGVGIAPINAGSVYHSNNMFLNHAAINVIWNFGESIISDEIDHEKFEYYSQDKKTEYLREALQSGDTVINILNGERPDHIIFIVLESFTANAVNILGGEEGLTPGIKKWSNEGILFSNFYANSDRSDKGLVSIFSSIPPVLSYSVMKHPEKSRHLPSIISELTAVGYKSSFYYGGDINFANMQSYLKQAGFQNIIAQNNLSLDCIQSTKWGYHDECMFDLLYEDLMNETGKSVNVLFTLSSHEPYDVPGAKIFPEDTEMNKARNAYYYTDSCLNVFLEKLEASPEWDNSLVILVSDHGTRFPGNVELWDLPKFHILMLWLGGALDSGPFVYSQFADQADISASLLSELGIPHDKFIFSENMFRKKTPVVFYSFNHGYTFIKDSAYYIYDVNVEKPIIESENSYNFEKYAKSYMQFLSEYYKNLGK